GALVAFCLAFAAAAAAQPAHVPGQVIVKFKADATGQEKAAARKAAGVSERLSVVRGTRAQVFDLKGARGAGAAIKALERSPAVRYAERNYIYTTQAVPNDPRFGELWGLNNTG